MYAFRFEFGSGGMKLYLDGNLVDSNDYEGGLTGNNNLIIAAGQRRTRSDADRIEHYFFGNLSDFRMLDVMGVEIDLFADSEKEEAD